MLPLMNKFPIFEYLDKLGIKYRKSGKNIGTGWIGIERCPRCGDSKYHFGVSRETGAFNCWVCGTKGNLVHLLMLLERINATQAIRIIKENTVQDLPQNLLQTLTEILLTTPEKPPVIKPTSLSLPSHKIPLDTATKRYDAPKNFLIKRGFEEADWNEWGAYYCFSGDYTMRIIFPLYKDEKLVNFIGRSVVSVEKRYHNCPREQMLLSLKECCYGDVNKEEIIICEGIFDALKLKKLMPKRGTLVVFGKQLAPPQQLILMKSNPKIVWVMLDMDAWAETIKLTHLLTSLLFCPVIPVFPNLKDPGDYQNSDELDTLFKDSINCIGKS